MRLGCSRCGKILSTEVPEGTLVRAWIECPECIKKEPEWDKEFEAKWEVETKYKKQGFDIKCGLVSKETNEPFGKLLYRYIKEGKVKIKCKDGLIQIERIK